jgi:beta-glucosidase
MEITRRAVGCAVSVLLLASLSCAAIVDDAPAPVQQRIEGLLQQMTLEEKLGQLNQLSYGRGAGPRKGQRDYEQMIADGQIGSLLNATGAKQTNELQRIAIERSRLKIPILFGLDVIHGYRTTFPVPLALSATWNPDLAQRTAAVAAREAAAEGVRWTFSPMIDIARDARWGRIVEGAGEDPFLGAAFARAYVRGYQGERLDAPTSIAACAKHYVGYGAAEAGRDYNTTEISDRTLRDVYLPPYEAAVRAGVLTIMSAFNAINGVPATANAQALDTILRKEWGFGGFVVSDWTAVKELIEHGVANDAAIAGRKAICAGVDMDMESQIYLKDLADEVRARRLPIEVVDEAVRRVLRVKMALGLFEHPYTPEAPTTAPLRAEDIDLARVAAEQSFVLLKNGDSAGAPALPLNEDARTIALIGPLADAPEDMLGSWSARGDSKDVVTLRAALTEYASQKRTELLYEKGSEIIGGTSESVLAAVDAARRADVVLLAVGESAAMNGEAASRTRLELPGLQPELLNAVAGAGKPIVLIVFSGRPLVLTPYVGKVDAIVQAWHPGLQAGPALVRVLTGQTDFTGRLTVTFPRSLGQVPLYYNHLSTGRPATGVDLSRPATRGTDKFVSRYLDEVNAPLYPFGYGLSYTNFEYATPTVSTESLSARAINDKSEVVKVSTEIRNSGSRAGVTVAQLYIRQRGTSVARPVRELKGFQRIELKPGESRRVEFTIGREELSFWNAEMKRIVEPASVSVWIATDAQSGDGAAFAITE